MGTGAAAAVRVIEKVIRMVRRHEQSMHALLSAESADVRAGLGVDYPL